MTEFLAKSKNRLSLKEFEVVNTSSYGIAGHTGQSDITDPASYKVKIIKEEDMFLEFDLIGCDPTIANAIRRILISDVPTMAIEKVYMYQNTSIMQDEVLAHRLGLIPLRADPRLFNWKDKDAPDEGTEHDTLEFSLSVRCRRNPIASEPGELPYKDHHVYTKHIQWIPKGTQEDRLVSPGPVEDDILINKMRPGHEMDLKMYAVKGIGRDHAKFSPVATAFYRLHPAIRIIKDVYDKDALRLQSCFTPGVIQLEPTNDGRKKAVVIDARNDSCSRNVYRHDDLKDCVELEKIKDHFIFNIESTGAIKPTEMVPLALDILVEKCDIFLKEIDKENT